MVSRAEAALHGNEISVRDPRFIDEARSISEALLKAPAKSTTFARVASSGLANREASGQVTRKALEAWLSIIQKIDRFRSQKLQDELSDVAHLIMPDCAALVCAIYGWDGSEPGTLEDIGSAHNLLGRRVYELKRKFEARAKRLTLYLPILDDCLSLIDETVPANVDQLEEKLVAAGYVREHYSLELLHQAARLYGRAPNWHIDSRSKSAISRDERGIPTFVLQACRRLTTSFGVCSTNMIIEHLSSEKNVSVDVSFVQQVVTESENCRWLDDSQLWLFDSETPITRNRLSNHVKKIMCAARFVELSDLLSGASRHYRFKGGSPPLHVFVQFCHTLPWLRIRGEWAESMVTGTSGILDDMETCLLEYFAKNRIAARKDLFEFCLSRGKNTSTFDMALSNSPIIAWRQYTSYRLRGADSVAELSDIDYSLDEPGLENLIETQEDTPGFDPEMLEDHRKRILQELAIRSGQPEFRQALLSAYDGACAISGFDCQESLEAAHIFPYRGATTNAACNGLLLRADLHALFDLGFWSIDAKSMRVIISEDLHKTKYAELAGISMREPSSPSQRPTKGLLEWHRQHIFKG